MSAQRIRQARRPRLKRRGASARALAAPLLLAALWACAAGGALVPALAQAQSAAAPAPSQPAPTAAQGPAAPAAAPVAIAPVQRIAFYPGAFPRPIEDKVTVGGPEVLDRALKTNLEYGQNVRPGNASPDNPLLPKVQAILRALPRPVHDLASRFVAAIYLLEDDWGTGTTEGVQDADGHWRYTYITLNLTALTRTANAWAAWKENSAFRQQPRYRIGMTLQPPEGDTLENAIQFILIHELGHAIGLGLRVHGFWDEEGLPPVTRDSSFIALSWTPDGKGWFVSKYAEKFPKLVQARFYRFEQAPLPLEDAEPVYRALAQTNLPSLYAVTNVYDDFAETFAVYVHTRLLNKPYRVDLFEDNRLRYSYTSCIVANTCPDKVRALEALLSGK